MRIALLKVGEIGLDRCLGRYMALLPRVLLFSARGTLACFARGRVRLLYA